MPFGDDVVYEVSLKDMVTDKLRNMEAEADKLESKFRTLGSSFGSGMSGFGNIAGGIAAGFQLSGLIDRAKNFGESILDVTAKYQSMENVVKFTSGSIEEAATNQEFLNRIIRDYKLPLFETTEGYAKLNAALMETTLSGNEARKMFEGLAIANTALHLPKMRQNEALLALTEMASEGKVHSRQLYRMLGFAIPGAPNIMADALGMSQAKMREMMQKNQINSAEALPKFAEELKKRFEGYIPTATKSLQANTIEYDNALLQLKNTIGTELLPEITKMLHEFTEFFGYLKDHKKELIEWGNVISRLAVAYMGIKGAMLLTNNAMAIYAAFMEGYAGTAVKAITETEALGAAQVTGAEGVQAMNVALAEQAALLNATSEASAVNATAASMMGKKGMAAMGGAAIGEAAEISAGAAALPVAILAISAGAAVALTSAMYRKGQHSEYAKGTGMYDTPLDFYSRPFRNVKDTTHYTLKDNPDGTKDTIYDYNLKRQTYKEYQDSVARSRTAMFPTQEWFRKNGYPNAMPDEPKKNNKSAGIMAEGVDKVRGQNVKNYNITINGGLVHEFTVTTNTMQEAPQKVKEHIISALLDAINDSQIQTN